MTDTPNDGGHAFPMASDLLGHTPGMSLRDWFAGQALNGLISKLPVIDQTGEFGMKVVDKIGYNKAVAASCRVCSRAL